MEDPTIPNSRVPASSNGSPDGRVEQMARLDRRFRSALLAYFGRRVRNGTEAEDLTQDVFERILRALDTNPIRNPEALVFSIAANLVRDQGRRTHAHGIEEPIPTETIAEFADFFTVDLTPERVVLGERTLEEAFLALGELGERTRAMFLLFKFENLKVRQIAEMYGITPSGVEKQLEKAVMHLTRRLHRP